MKPLPELEPPLNLMMAPAQTQMPPEPILDRDDTDDSPVPLPAVR